MKKLPAPVMGGRRGGEERNGGGGGKREEGKRGNFFPGLKLA